MQRNREKRGNEILFDGHVKEQNGDEKDWGEESRWKRSEE